MGILITIYTVFVVEISLFMLFVCVFFIKKKNNAG